MTQIGPAERYFLSSLRGFNPTFYAAVVCALRGTSTAQAATAIGSIRVGSSSPATVRFTRGDTGHSRSVSSGAHFSTSAPSVPFSHPSKFTGSRITGMRLWCFSIQALAPHTMMVADSLSTRLPGSRHCSHSPAKAHHRSAIGGGEQMRLAGALFACPLVEAAGRDDTAPLLEGAAEHRLGRRGFRARIEGGG